MIPLKLLAISVLAVHAVYGDKNCNGFCGQGEGDCDRDSDCYDGLVCEFDGWWGTDYCRAGPNTVDWSWSAWGDFGDCSVECGADGTQERFRYCNAPSNGGYPCPSQMDSETQTCNNGPCPVNGGWGAFGEWDECPVSCGGAEHSRTRECGSPAPEYGGVDCTVDGSTNIETEACNENPCPINGGWGDWSEFDECPVSCGGADQSRYRECNNPAPEFGGEDCAGDASETQRCNENPCPINGDWGAFGEWDECPVSCGGADQSRYRTCDSPAPEFGGEDCAGDASETQRCNENPCPIDGGFSDWDEWDACTAACGGGDQTRLRRCDNPAPEFGGLDCVGDLSECQRCNLDPCPSTCPA